MGRQPHDVISRIRQFNKGRQPDLVQLKYQKMAASPFAFLRGTCHLFYADWPRRSVLNAAPQTWICGDLHAENLGGYLGANRLTYFDITDFDEAVLAPCTWDLTRFVTSVMVGAPGVTSARLRIARRFLDAYGAALVNGKAEWVERETATGRIAALLDGLRTKTRAKLLKKRTRKNGRKLTVDGKYAWPANASQRADVKAFVESLHGMPFGRVLDVARRIAGNGSLGIERYVVLVDGSARPRTSLIDIKRSLPSSLTPYLRGRQPAWKTEAERVVAVQRQAQAMPQALLAAVELRGNAFVLRELQPREDRIVLETPSSWQHFSEVVETMGQVVAWAHLRGSSQRTAAAAEELGRFAQAEGWKKDVLTYATAYSRRVRADWQVFRKAQQHGELTKDSNTPQRSRRK